MLSGTHGRVVRCCGRQLGAWSTPARGMIRVMPFGLRRRNILELVLCVCVCVCPVCCCCCCCSWLMSGCGCVRAARIYRFYQKRSCGVVYCCSDFHQYTLIYMYTFFFFFVRAQYSSITSSSRRRGTHTNIHKTCKKTLKTLLLITRVCFCFFLLGRVLHDERMMIPRRREEAGERGEIHKTTTCA